MMIFKNDMTMRLLAAAGKAWENGALLRATRLRNKRFTYGDQWGDIVTDRSGNRLTERADARNKGREPMTNNLIRRLVKCIVGRFRMSLENRKYSDDALKEVYLANNLDEMDSRMLEEFLISGCAIQRVVSERRPSGSGVWVDNVSPARFFVNAISDPRGVDIEMVGMLHDMSIAEVVMRFSGGDSDKERLLRHIYGATADFMPGREVSFGRSLNDSIAFERAAVDGRCRVIELWTLEARRAIRWHDAATGTWGSLPLGDEAQLIAENRKRKVDGATPLQWRTTLDARWHCRWLAPDGSLLEEYDSPYAHGSHPFVVKFYPLTDGEIHSFVEDIVDQQKYINRLITLLEHVMASSAKGVLLFPENAKVERLSWEEISELWSAPDAIIPYNPRMGSPEPKQLVTSASDFGARELLSLEVKMLEDVSGVSSSLLGRSSSGGNVGYERFESEVRNATVAINDLLLTFDHFRGMRDDKVYGING